MSYNAGSKIITNGLIFSFNANSERSYAGPPIQNMATTIAASGSFSDTNIAYTAGTETANIPTLGSMTVPYMDGYNANSGSYCCLQPFYFVVGNGYVACSGSTQYTYSVVYRTTSGYTHPNYMYRYEYTSGGSYVTEVGVHDDTKRVHLGDGWYWAWNTFTTQATTARLYLRSFYYQYNVSDRHSIARVLVTPGDYTSLPPRLWPAVGTTRSSTQTILDPVGQNTITTVGSPTFNTDRLTIPNNNTSYLSVSPSTNFNMGTQDFTISAWVKQLDNSPNIITEARDGSALQGYLFLINYPSSGKIAFFVNPSSGQAVYYTTAATLGYNVIQNIVAVVKRSNATIEMYVNGALYDTITGVQTASISGTGDMYRIGYDRGGSTTNMDIYAYSHYNRALTAAEVQQNFNALRGRYGI